MKEYNSVWVLWDKKTNAIGRVHSAARTYGVYVRKGDVVNASRRQMASEPGRYDIHEINLAAALSAFYQLQGTPVNGNETVVSSEVQEKAIWRKSQGFIRKE